MSHVDVAKSTCHCGVKVESMVSVVALAYDRYAKTYSRNEYAINFKLIRNVRKFRLDPNAKEFNPGAAPFLSISSSIGSQSSVSSLLSLVDLILEEFVTTGLSSH